MTGMRFCRVFPLTLVLLASFSSCKEVDDDRIPNMPVSIRLGDTGLWNTYGVSGFGNHRRFILSSGIREPRSFPFSEASATGFGGVLLISGMDPFSGATDVPLAYDLACPVERQPNVRVAVDAESLNAVCPDCGSVFNVVTAAGSPLSGPAASSSPCALRRYNCFPSGNGGYFITN